ncbi:MAG: hypothetical protein ACOYOP_06845 [Microthrixaceae bacterium]
MSDDTLPAPGAPATVDPEEFARLAAEVVALVEHHRDELRAAMAELTALQRTIRAEVRDAVALLQEAAQAASATVPGPAGRP